MQPMTIDQLAAMRLAVLTNVADLIAEAELLSEGHHARAYALAVLACEEAAKIHPLTIAAMSLAMGKAIDWDKVDRRLHGHKAKLFMASLYGPVLDVPPADYLTVDPNDRAARWREAQRVNGLKQAAIYVGCGDAGQPATPLDSISTLQTASMLRAARRLLKFFSFAERTLGRGISRWHAAPWFGRCLNLVDQLAELLVGSARQVSS